MKEKFICDSMTIDLNDLNKQLDILTKMSKEGLTENELLYYDGLFNFLCTLTETNEDHILIDVIHKKETPNIFTEENLLVAINIAKGDIDGASFDGRANLPPFEEIVVEKLGRLPIKGDKIFAPYQEARIIINKAVTQVETIARIIRTGTKEGITRGKRRLNDLIGTLKQSLKE